VYAVSGSIAAAGLWLLGVIRRETVTGGGKRRRR
jgi:hypothetical protein